MSFDRSLLAMPDRRFATIDLPVPDTDFRKPMIAGLTMIGIALGGFGAWASLASLDSAVVSQGVVTVESKRKTVQHREGGIVREVLVHEGQTVAAGTVIARLDDSGADSQMVALKAQLDAKQAEQARLVAERDGSKAIAFPAGLETRAPDAAARERDRFTERRKTLDGQVSILEQRIAQLQAGRTGKVQVEAARRKQMTLLQDELSGLRQLEAKGFYPRNKLRASERELARLQGELATDGAGTNQTDKEIGENRLQILQTRQKFRDDVAAELTKTEIEVNELGAKLVAARDAVERLAVIAPVDGQVQNLKPAGKGSVVAPGGDIAEIVPAEDKLVVETQINPRDVESVHSGQNAELRFTAFSSRTTPVVEGAVQVVSGDRLTDQATHQPYYLARVEVPADQVARLPGELKAGMPVDVMVKSASRTPLQYLLKPLTDSFARSFKER